MTKKKKKQRKRQLGAPLHKKQKFMSAHLSADLREEYGIRNVPIRKGDKVRVLRGDYIYSEGEVMKVDLKNSRVFIEDVTAEKTDGSEVNIPFHPSNLEIIEMDLGDDERRELVERRGL